MTEPAPVDLIDLRDAAGDRCVVRVTGRYRPGVLTGHDTLRAEVLIFADFVDARLEVFLFQEDLDNWQRDLSRLAPGRGATLGRDRGLVLHLLMQEDRTLWLSVEDLDRLNVLLGIDPQDTWIQEHHQRLDHVRKTWPSEVVETAPMTYAWSSGRESPARHDPEGAY
ncbi:DUF5959 family protein [Streptomyces nojiriensis]|uniref:DUF5959 family protein n=1 Tax=Streptomyces nojiriensis TaxID=66374 RepID=UPI0035DCE699